MSAPASPATAIVAQTAMELRLTARRGENLLALIGIPVIVLVFFASVDVLPVPADGTRIDVLLPGVLALAVLAAGMVNLGIATAYERAYGVLKRLGGSPLGRTGLLSAKIVTIGIVEVVVATVLIVIAAAGFGWRPGPEASPAGFVVALALGTAAFVGIGLAMAGTLRAEATLTLANVLFLASILLGGIIVPAGQLPDPLATIAGILPGAALADAFRVALGGGGDLVRPLVIVGAWAVIAIVVTIRTFRWE
jgi:ABC-2 type transport system permease protein